MSEALSKTQSEQLLMLQSFVQMSTRLPEVWGNAETVRLG
jgi:hypothetical protein